MSLGIKWAVPGPGTAQCPAGPPVVGYSVRLVTFGGQMGDVLRTSLERVACLNCGCPGAGFDSRPLESHFCGDGGACGEWWGVGAAALSGQCVRRLLVYSASLFSNSGQCNCVRNVAAPRMWGEAFGLSPLTFRRGRRLQPRACRRCPAPASLGSIAP